MRIHNNLEVAVKSAVAEARKHGEEARQCWCPLCEADVTALALTNLPPCYSTLDCEWAETFSSWRDRARRAVTSAAAKVSRSPKHGRFQREPGWSTVDLVNFIFREVAALVDDRGVGSCSCDRCMDDVMTYTLNRYPSKYGVIWNGTVRFPKRQRSLLRDELQVLLKNAATVVTSRPHHHDT